MTDPPGDHSPPVRTLHIPDRGAGRRVDQFLALRFRTLSRTAAARAIRAGLVTSAARPIKPSSLLRAGEELHVRIPGFAPDGPPPPFPQVLFEDEAILVLNKPAGILVHPAGDKWAWAIIGMVKEARPGCRVDLVHRLDRDTSGVLVLTKDLDANVFLKERFRVRAQALNKIYLAVVRGQPDWDHREIEVPIGDDARSEVRLRRAVCADGQQAWTTVRVVERMPTRGLTLVSCHIHTGRTHQIRVHLEHVGLPILGDRLYGHDDDVFLEWLEEGATPEVRRRVGYPRQCLHAWRLSLPHPSGATLDIEAPLPSDMAALRDGAVPSWPDPSTPETRP